MLNAIPELIRAFRLAIFDLSLKVKNEKGTLSPNDIENTHFVVGMAQVIATNLQKALDLGQSYYQDNAEKVDRLINEATALSLITGTCFLVRVYRPGWPVNAPLQLEFSETTRIQPA